MQIIFVEFYTLLGLSLGVSIQIKVDAYEMNVYVEPHTTERLE